MAKKIIKARLKQRTDTQANWAANNPVLLAGELGLVTDDKNLYKVGDGVTAWNDLPFRGFDGTLVHETGDSDNAAMSQRGVTRALAKLEESMVEKVPGMGLSTEDYTTEEKRKLAGLQNFNDTEIQEKLTELSAEVREVSEAVEGKEDKANKTTSLSASSTDVQYPSAKSVFMAISRKSEASLEILNNGNIKVTINGVSKDFMPATPSGDPQHDAYVSAGAAYNATANDINKLGLYGDTITHKSGCWLLNEVGDLTNEEMRNIYSQRLSANSVEGLKAYWRTCTTRTTCSLCNIGQGTHDTYALFYNCTNLLIAQAGRTPKNSLSILTVTGSGLVNFFYGSQKLEKALFIIDASSATSSSRFCDKCYALQYIRVKGLKVGISFADSAQLSNDSILYMINNEVATAAIAITLHADAYARAMADAEITAALVAHPNVSLAKA